MTNEKKQKIKKPLVITLITLICCALALAIIFSGFELKYYVRALDYQFGEFSGAAAHGERIHFLNTKNSDAILLESNGHYALVDCGEDNDNPRDIPSLDLDGYEQTVIDYVNKICGVNGKVTLDFIIGTHAHSDHIGGFDTLIAQENITINKAYLKKYDEKFIIDKEVNKWDNKQVYDQMVAALAAKDIPLEQDLEDLVLKLQNFDLTIFNGQLPREGVKVGENENSLAILAENNGVKTLLSGDLNNIDGDEDRVASEVGEIDILKIGHHGYKLSSSRNFINKLSPALAIQTNVYPVDFSVKWTISMVNDTPIYGTAKMNGIVVDFTNGIDGLKLYKNSNGII